MNTKEDKASSEEGKGKKWWTDPTVIAAIILTVGTLGSAILSRWP